MCMCSSKTCFPCRSPFPTFLFCPGHQGCMANSAWLVCRRRTPLRSRACGSIRRGNGWNRPPLRCFRCGTAWCGLPPRIIGGWGDAGGWDGDGGWGWGMGMGDCSFPNFPISTLLHLPSRNLSFPRWFSIIFSSCSTVFPTFSAVFSPSPGPQDHPIFTELVGGAWQVLPGLRASMWRVLADPAPGGHGVGISEITFYRCLGENWEGLGLAWRGSGGWGDGGDGGDGNDEMICLIHVDTESGSSMLWSFVQQLEGEGGGMDVWGMFGDGGKWYEDGDGDCRVGAVTSWE